MTETRAYGICIGAVEAARQCYRELLSQMGPGVRVAGLGTTGSGRQITALHAGNQAVIINEIIAHALAAAYFDKDADTIFEIGGQDAKYTQLVNGVPCDYAMNEACSAGTGSFLEESVQEALGIAYTDIEKIALTSRMPRNFNDQCAGFIHSDIKTAVHENVAAEDIVAGLVYSVCMNYINRVKGQRPVGRKVYMQGGVCYNKAVPFAMANLTGKAVLAQEPDNARAVFERQRQRLVECFSHNRAQDVFELLKDSAIELRTIPLKYPLSDACTVAVSGEIFVRREEFTCGHLLRRLAEHGIVARRAPVLEWLKYCDYNVAHGLYHADFNVRGFLAFQAKRMLQRAYEKKVKRILAATGLYRFEMIDIDRIMGYAKNFFDTRFTGETLLVTGGFFHEILHACHGMVSIGPFACMHSRVTEAVLSAQSTLATKRMLDAGCRVPPQLDASVQLPFLSIETDGGSFPQILEAKIEAFCLQAKRLHRAMTARQVTHVSTVTVLPTTKALPAPVYAEV